MALGISEQQAISICESPAFARKLSISSPYRDFSELIDAARNIWWKEIGPSEWLSAFAAHPRIGESKAADERSEEFAAFSRSEQETAAQTVDAEVSKELQQWNKLYYDKFGFIFIIFAKGRSSPEILSCLKERFHRLPYEELQTAAREQMKIAELRLGHLFGLSSDLELQRRTQKRADHVLNQLTAAHTSAPLRSPITCHVLDSAQGVPAQGMPLALFKLEEHSSMWEKVSSGVTNEDGRVGALLPPSNYLAPGKYRMFFDTTTYLKACKLKHPSFYSDIPFYPEVTICFDISPDKATEHYHIPLLLSPFGYSTYRGS